MPIYEYLCNGCGGEFEELVLSMGSDVACKMCDSSDLTKIMSGFSVKSGNSSDMSSSGGDCGSCVSKNCSSCN